MAEKASEGTPKTSTSEPAASTSSSTIEGQGASQPLDPSSSSSAQSTTLLEESSSAAEENTACAKPTEENSENDKPVNSDNLKSSTEALNDKTILANDLDEPQLSRGDDLCRICMDSLVDCILLECGHMVTCTQCGKRLADCPICRQYVVRVVRVFRSWPHRFFITAMICVVELLDRVFQKIFQC